MKIMSPLTQRTAAQAPAAPRPRRGFLLLLILVLAAAGCAPQVASGSWPGIAADTDGLVVASTDHITRLNDVGTARWEYPPTSERGQAMFAAQPALTEEAVYVAGFNSNIYALSRSNGQPIWINEDATTSQIIGGLTVAQGLVLVGLGDEGFIALDQRNGDLVWRFETGHGVWSTPLVIEDTVYFTSLDKNIYAVDLESGEELWRQDLEGAVAGTPAYGDGVLYVGSFAHKFFALSASTGEILRSFDTNNWVWGGPALVDGLVYFGDLSGYMYVLDAATFNPVWQRQVASEAIRATPLVLDDLVIVGARDDKVYAMERDGGLPVWTQDAGADVLSDLVTLDDGLVVVGTLDSESLLIAYDPADGGREVWRFPPAAASE